MKKIYFVFFLLIFGACFNENKNNEEKDVASGISIEREGNILKVYANENSLGLEIYINKDLSEKQIIIDDSKLMILKENIISLVSTKDEIKKGEKIFEINTDSILNLNLIENIDISNLESFNLKRAINPQFLGDFNDDGLVKINDFTDFVKNYGTTNSAYDIAPASLGENIFKNVYSYVNKDGKVNISDFVIFGQNYGKILENYSIKLESSLENIKLGDSFNLKAYIESTNEEINPIWENLTEDILEIDENALVRILKAGTGRIKATYGKASTEIAIKVEEIKEYYNDGEFLTYIKNNEDESTAINLIVMGDGYIKEDLKSGGAYEIEAKKLIDGFFKYPPFSQFKENFNAYIIYCESNDRGADQSQYSEEADTVFDSNYGQSGIDRLLVIKNTSKVSEYINNAGLQAKNALYKNIMLISVNDEKYGGSGGTYAVVSKNSYAIDVAVHEIGHSFGGLADEYNYGETFPKENAVYQKNVDITNDLKNIKWSHFIGLSGYEDVRAYEGGFYYATGVWRPTSHCMMEALGYEFCPVCREAIVKVIYQCVGKTYSFDEFLERDKENLVDKKSQVDLSDYPEMIPYYESE